MDCSSYTELYLSDKVGFHGDEIMFSSNVTPEEDFRLAADLDAIINFDDITHLKFYEKLAPFRETMPLQSGRRLFHSQSDHGHAPGCQIWHDKSADHRGFFLYEGKGCKAFRAPCFSGK